MIAVPKMAASGTATTSAATANGMICLRSLSRQDGISDLIVVTHRKLERMNDRRTENGGERHRDNKRCNGKWHDLPPEFVTPGWDIRSDSRDSSQAGANE